MRRLSYRRFYNFFRAIVALFLHFSDFRLLLPIPSFIFFLCGPLFE